MPCMVCLEQAEAHDMINITAPEIWNVIILFGVCCENLHGPGVEAS